MNKLKAHSSPSPQLHQGLRLPDEDSSTQSPASARARARDKARTWTQESRTDEGGEVQMRMCEGVSTHAAGQR